MRRHIIILALALAAAFILPSCYKDKGNYDYNDINQLTISNIDSVYSVRYGDSINIKPIITYTADPAPDTANYTYEWYNVSVTTGSVLATTPELHIRATKAVGLHSVYYRVTDKRTGVEFSRSFRIVITKDLQTGWMVMCNVNGTARLDMISIGTDTTKIVNDLLAYVDAGIKMEGTPNDISFVTYKNVGSLFLATSKKSFRIDPNTYKWSSTLNIENEILSDVPADFTANFFYMRAQNHVYMHAGTDVYYNYYTSNIYFSLPINIMSGAVKPFRAAPFLAQISVGTNPVIMFDMDKRKFVRFLSGGSSCQEMPAGTLFNYTVNKDLVYMEGTRYNASDVFAILKDTTAANYYLATFAVTSNIAQRDFINMNATDISKAEGFAVSPNLGYVFYYVGSKLYEYDKSLNSSKLMIDFGSKKISHIRFHNFYSDVYAAERNKLIVCSYDPAQPDASNGIMEFYSVPSANGALQLLNTYTGLGKITTLTYR